MEEKSRALKQHSPKIWIFIELLKLFLSPLARLKMLNEKKNNNTKITHIIDAAKNETENFSINWLKKIIFLDHINEPGPPF